MVKKFGNSGAVVHSLLSPSYLDKGHVLFVDNWYSSPLLFRYLYKCNTFVDNWYSSPLLFRYLHKCNTFVDNWYSSPLLFRYLHKCNTFVDNWYSSSLLFRYLHKCNTGACGTVRLNRKHMPKFTKKLKRGETECYRRKMLLAIKWSDKRHVSMLTTVNTPAIVDTSKKHYATGEFIRKPECVVSYTKNMGAVDKTDMQISLTECTRKTRKWYRKLFFHLLDMCLYNAFVLYRVNTNNKKMQFIQFRTNVAEQLLELHRPLRIRNTGGRPSASI